MKRKSLTTKTKLAATLLQMKRYDDAEAEFVPVITYEESKTLSADQIIARFHFDHNIAHADGGPDEPWNLTPMTVEEHRIKTARIDVPRIAKSKRLAKRQAGEKKQRTMTRWRNFRNEIVTAPRER